MIGRSRTTISIEPKLFEAALKRSKALGYKGFSEYLAYLIESDLHERGKHVTIREESDTGYGPKKKAQK